jgi:flagellar protein FliO/FliZ
MIANFLAQADPLLATMDGGLVRAVVGTFFVLALVTVLAVLLRRGVLTLPGQRGPRTLRVETALSLGDRRSLVIVNVEGRRLLLGLTSAQVSVVTELGAAPAAFDRVLAQASSAGPGSSS